MAELLARDSPAEADQQLAEAIELHRFFGDTPTLAQVLERRGELRFLNGEVALGLELLEQAVTVLDASEAPRDPPLELILLRKLALVALRHGQLETALSASERALHLVRELSDLEAEGRILEQLSEICAGLDRLPEALAQGEAALAIARELGRPTAETSVLVMVAGIATQLGELDKAVAYYKAAQPNLEGHSAANLLRELAQIHSRKTEPSLSIERYKEAEEAYRALGDIPAADQALLDRTRLRLDLGQADEARAELTAALDVADRDSLQGQSREERRSGLSRVTAFSRMLVAVLIALGDYDGAFEAAEHGRARELRSRLRERDVADRDPELRKEVYRKLVEMRYFRHQLGLHRHTSEDEDDSVSRHLERQAIEAQQAYEALATRYRSPDPKGGIVWTRRRVQEELLDEQTALLEYVLCDEPLKSFLFVLTDQRIEIIALPSKTEMESKARQLRAAILYQMPRMPYGHDLYQALIAPAEHLLEGRDLIIVPDGGLHLLPFAALLTAPPDAGEALKAPFRVSITLQESSGKEESARSSHRPETIDISADWLSIHPGAIDDEEMRLIEDTASRMAGLRPFDWRTLSMLIDRYTISHAPSATVAGLLRLAAKARSGAEAYSGTLLAFGDPATDGLFLHAGGQRVPLPNLPNSRQEVRLVAETVAKVIPPVSYETRIQLWTGPRATKARAVDEMLNPSSFRFLHFALHGNLTTRDSELSSLVFAPDREDDDPFLSALEISTDSIEAELAVLSACDTGCGRIQSGEGVLGLARAFLSAGTLGVCAASWSLEDRSTSLIMPRFYRGFLQGDSKAEALRDAQLWLRHATSADLAAEPAIGELEQISERLDDSTDAEVNSNVAPYAHPFYWAGFVHHGA